MYNFDPYNVLLSIATNIPVLLMTSVGESYLKVMHYNIALLPKKVTNYVT